MKYGSLVLLGFYIIAVQQIGAKSEATTGGMEQGASIEKQGELRTILRSSDLEDDVEDFKNDIRIQTAFRDDRVQKRIIAEHQVVRGMGEKLIFQRVPRPTTNAFAEPRQSEQRTEKPEPPEFERVESPEIVLVRLSATVYDRTVTELKLTVDGDRHTVWSNVDFNLLSGLTDIEHQGKIYCFLIGLGNESTVFTREREGKLKSIGIEVRPPKRIPELTDFPSLGVSYIAKAENAIEEHDADPTTLIALTLLNRYYEENGAALEQAYIRREAISRAREEYFKSREPEDIDTIIRYWPVRGSAYSEN